MDDSPEDGDFNSDPGSVPSEQVASAEESDKDTSEKSSLILSPEGASSIRKVSFLKNSSDNNHRPKVLNLDTSGLRRSTRMRIAQQ